MQIADTTISFKSKQKNDNNTKKDKLCKWNQSSDNAKSNSYTPNMNSIKAIKIKPTPTLARYTELSIMALSLRPIEKKSPNPQTDRKMEVTNLLTVDNFPRRSWTYVRNQHIYDILLADDCCHKPAHLGCYISDTGALYSEPSVPSAQVTSFPSFAWPATPDQADHSKNR